MWYETLRQMCPEPLTGLSIKFLSSSFILPPFLFSPSSPLPFLFKCRHWVSVESFCSSGLLYCPAVCIIPADKLIHEISFRRLCWRTKISLRPLLANHMAIIWTFKTFGHVLSNLCAKHWCSLNIDTYLPSLPITVDDINIYFQFGWTMSFFE